MKPPIISTVHNYRDTIEQWRIKTGNPDELKIVLCNSSSLEVCWDFFHFESKLGTNTEFVQVLVLFFHILNLCEGNSSQESPCTSIFSLELSTTFILYAS